MGDALSKKQKTPTHSPPPFPNLPTSRNSACALSVIFSRAVDEVSTARAPRARVVGSPPLRSPGLTPSVTHLREPTSLCPYQGRLPFPAAFCYTDLRMTGNHETLLRKLGFTDSAARVYLAALELGPSPVQVIAKKANISRPSAYAAIDELSEDGLMSSVESGKKRLYAAESPDRLLSFVHSRVKRMETLSREVEDRLTQLKLLAAGERPVVRLFEGLEGLRAIQDDIQRTHPKEILEIGNNDVIKAMFPTHIDPHLEALQKRKSKVRAIVLYDKVKPPERAGWEFRHLSPKDHAFEGDVSVYDNKVALSVFKGKLVSILIESKDLADTVRTLFNLAWK